MLLGLVKMFLDIHLEYCDDKGEKLRKIIELGKPFSISVVPVLLLPEHEVFKKGIYPFDYYYPKEIVDILKEFSKNPNVVFGQQGYLHYCQECFKRKEKRDPWHENTCLYNRRKIVEEQKKFMEEGKKVIENILRVSPVLYIPPNHQFDKNSKIAAEELGFKFFAIRKILNVQPYKERNLIILPEREGLEEKGEIIYDHYDKITKDFDEYLGLIKKSCSVYDITPVKQSVEIIAENEKQIISRKKKRDAEKKKKKSL